MRAFLALLLFTLLPLQFSAAAVAARCGHVAAIQGPHAQHHQPAAGWAAQCVEDLAAGGSGGVELECDTCHAHGAAVSTSTTPMADPARLEPVEHLVERRLPPWRERPYRPQWSAPKGSGWHAFA